ncbi:hypothetical protein LTR08_003007 [Meristemomyces frigidus]|nr:hypothetical protein LTR08_003007 [Meristemomyces frigidus]
MFPLMPIPSTAGPPQRARDKTKNSKRTFAFMAKRPPSEDSMPTSNDGAATIDKKIPRPAVAETDSRNLHDIYSAIKDLETKGDPESEADGSQSYMDGDSVDTREHRIMLVYGKGPPADCDMDAEIRDMAAADRLTGEEYGSMPERRRMEVEAWHGHAHVLDPAKSTLNLQGVTDDSAPQGKSGWRNLINIFKPVAKDSIDFKQHGDAEQPGQSKEQPELLTLTQLPSSGSRSDTDDELQVGDVEITRRHDRATATLPADALEVAPPSGIQHFKQESLRKQMSFANVGGKLKANFGGSRTKVSLESSRLRSDSGTASVESRKEWGPTARTPNTPSKPSGLRNAVSIDGTDERVSADSPTVKAGDPFVGEGESMPAGAEILPWEYQQHDGNFANANDFIKGVNQGVVQAFKNRYPAPPTPPSPTKVQGRSLQSSKSDSSMRTVATMAPSVAPSKRSKEVRIVNPDVSPLTYISKSANSTFPSSPEDPNWLPALQYVKRLMADDKAKEDQKAREEVVKKKASPKQLLEAERQERIKAGTLLINRSSVYGLTPTKDLSKMTEEELELYGSLVQEEIAKGDLPKGINKLFKKEGAKQARILKLAYLGQQMSHVGRATRAKAQKQMDAAQQAEANGEDEEAGIHISEALRMLECDDSGGSSNRVESDEVVPQEQTEKVWLDDLKNTLNRSPGHSTEYGEEAEERAKALKALSALTPTDSASSSPQAVGLGITHMNEAMSAREFGVARLSIGDDSQLSLPEAESSGSDAESSYSRNTDGMVSPCNLSPLKVPSSSRLPADRLKNGKGFTPDRSRASFLRKIIDLSQERALQLNSSHPAMRGEAGSSEIPPMSPFMGPFHITEDVERTVDQTDAQKYNDLPREPHPLAYDGSPMPPPTPPLRITKRAPPQPASRQELDSHQQDRPLFDEHRGADFCRPLPPGDSRTDVVRRQTLSKTPVNTASLFSEDEGYQPLPLNQQTLKDLNTDQVKTRPVGDTMRRKATHAEVIALDSFFGRDGNDAASDAGSDQTEYIDNVTYDPALDPSVNGQAAENDAVVNDSKVQKMHTDITSQPSISLEIDDAIRQCWPGATTSSTCAECSKILYPWCVVICKESLCRQVLCNEHGKGGRCSYHEDI